MSRYIDENEVYKLVGDTGIAKIHCTQIDDLPRADVNDGMKTPFENDIFALIWTAFQNLYPDKECTCYWTPNLSDEENGVDAFGQTNFADDGTIQVCVNPNLSVCDAAEVFAYELAHVAVGKDHEYDAEWENAFDAIFNEYNRIGSDFEESEE